MDKRIDTKDGYTIKTKEIAGSGAKAPQKGEKWQKLPDDIMPIFSAADSPTLINGQEADLHTTGNFSSGKAGQ